MSGLLVVGGVYVRGGRLLLARRPEGGACPGLWELPGGKVEPGESPAEALVREWREELGVSVLASEPYTFTVEERRDGPLTLLIFRVRGLAGEPRPLHAPALRFSLADEALMLATPPADAPVLARLAAEGGGRFLDTEQLDEAERRRRADEVDPYILGSEALAPGQVIRFKKRLAGSAAPLEGLLVLSGSGPRAYANVCPHVPVHLDREGEELASPDGEHLVCARHGALFTNGSGLCVAGPCEGESLSPLAIVPSGRGWALEAP